MTITDTHYLYYVRMDGNHPPYTRVLFRQKINLAWLAPLHPNITGLTKNKYPTH